MYVSLLKLTKISCSDFSDKVILHESSLGDMDGSLAAHTSITYTDIGFTVLKCDPSVYIFKQGDIKIIMPVPTDDCAAVTAPSDNIVDAFITELRKYSNVRDLGPINNFLGIIIKWNDNKLILH
jgi:hypothetical protein